jgi:hypothetical protein
MEVENFAVFVSRETGKSQAFTPYSSILVLATLENAKACPSDSIRVTAISHPRIATSGVDKQIVELIR